MPREPGWSDFNQHALGGDSFNALPGSLNEEHEGPVLLQAGPAFCFHEVSNPYGSRVSPTTLTGMLSGNLSGDSPHRGLSATFNNPTPSAREAWL